jgi:hypothetical protein
MTKARVRAREINNKKVRRTKKEPRTKRAEKRKQKTEKIQE